MRDTRAPAQATFSESAMGLLRKHSVDKNNINNTNTRDPGRVVQIQAASISQRTVFVPNHGAGNKNFTYCGRNKPRCAGNARKKEQSDEYTDGAPMENSLSNTCSNSHRILMDLLL